MKKTFFSGVLLLAAALVSFPAAGEESFEFPGKWNVQDSKTGAYFIYLDLGGSAMSDKGAGQMGGWSFSGEGIQIAWMDGTSDSIQRQGQAYQKISGSEVSRAEKVG